MAEQRDFRQFVLRWVSVVAHRVWMWADDRLDESSYVEVQRP